MIAIPIIRIVIIVFWFFQNAGFLGCLPKYTYNSLCAYNYMHIINKIYSIILYTL